MHAKVPVDSQDWYILHFQIQAMFRFRLSFIKASQNQNICTTEICCLKSSHQIWAEHSSHLETFPNSGAPLNTVSILNNKYNADGKTSMIDFVFRLPQ